MVYYHHMQCVYFLFFKDENVIKIGKTTKLKDRLRKLVQGWGKIDINQSFYFIPKRVSIGSLEKTIHCIFYSHKTTTDCDTDGHTELFHISSINYLDRATNALDELELIKKRNPLSSLDTVFLKELEKIKKKDNINEHRKSKRGHIFKMRQRLGMTLKQLSNMVGISTSTMAQTEKREASKEITLKNMERIAKCLNCTFIYEFKPIQNVEIFIKENAMIKARKIIERTDVHMALEDQEVKISIDERIEKFANKLIRKRQVW